MSYFTSRVALPQDKAKRQSTYIDAINTLADTSIYFGKYQTNPHMCRNCGRVHNANSEQMTDVDIAAELLQDAFQDASTQQFPEEVHNPSGFILRRSASWG
jgi:hypothetical protein